MCLFFKQSKGSTGSYDCNFGPKVGRGDSEKRKFQNSLPLSLAKVCLFFLFNILLNVFSLSPPSSFGQKLLLSAPVEPSLCLKNKQIHCFLITAQRRSLYALSLSEAFAGIHGRQLCFLTTDMIAK